uniref:DNA polymerase n=1 Tax=Tetraselmis sp. GSL018 TaxID=582737 RepID=A0A061RE64_9CHLO
MRSSWISRKRLGLPAQKKIWKRQNLGKRDGRNWLRPSAPALDNISEPLVFQQFDIDYVVDYSKEDPVPVLRMFGVNDAGNSVALFIHGFEPYFYVEAPTSDFGPDDCEQMCQELDRRLREGERGRSGCKRFVQRITLERRCSLMHYQAETSKPFLKIVVTLPKHIAPCRSLLESGFPVPSLGRDRAFATFESNVLFTLRFMVDCGIGGGFWVELAPTKWAPSEGGPRTYCQIEADAHFSDVVAHNPEGEWQRLAPLRVLSVDIECAGRKGHFPEASKDPVIQIASMVSVTGKAEPIVRNVMTLNSCAAIVGSQVMSFKTEEELLLRWRDLVLETDPDLIIGYNICNFDLPYLLDRAQALGVPSFPFWGRVRGSRTSMKDAKFSSKAYGTHEYKEITIEGRVQFDLLLAIQRDYKLSSYSLNAVSAHFLNEQKEDVHHSCISDLQAGNDETRRRLAVYCLKDALLPLRLFNKLMYMYNYVEMARVTGVPFSYLLTRGQSIKVFSQILRKARSKGFLVPRVDKQGAQDGRDVAYEGATVLDAKQGFYENPVATLDFASLYPSIMMAHNLCYSTLVPRDRVKDLNPEDVQKSPTGDTFVKSHLRKGFLPEILEELLGARKRAKADLKAATDPFVKAVLDGRQLALKVSANSVYGFTGATIGSLPCLEISASTTSYGREMIEHTRKLVQETYNRANGYAEDCDVIYGDTDSVMVNFKAKTVEEAMRLGQEAADYISTTFPKPIKLEFEKVYFPYLLISKKRYAGLYWTRPEKHDKMDAKGIETVRRDNCLLVRNVVSTCLEKLLADRDVDGAVGYVKSVVSDLLMNRLDLSLLVVSKGLTQAAEDYEAKAAHVELAKKMMKRDPATAPTVGDRVPYVIIKAAKGAKAWEKAEDPIYALEHGLPIDAQYYVDHYLELPLTRIFEPIMKNPKELFTGDHTRSIAMATPTSAAGGMMKFAKKIARCMGCKAALPANDSGASLCSHCAPRQTEIYSGFLDKVNDLEDQFASLWTQCQRCQGSLHQDVLCTSRDCPIFYRRKKVQKDLSEAHGQLERFSHCW